MQTEKTKFENLQKWEGMLAKCIRCGYCYEHCPMFKYSRWESDAPRAKNILSHGLLTGELDRITSYNVCYTKLLRCS